MGNENNPENQHPSNFQEHETSEYPHPEIPEMLKERHEKILSHRPATIAIDGGSIILDGHYEGDIHITTNPTPQPSQTGANILTRIFRKAKNLVKNGWIFLLATNTGWIIIILI